MVILEQYNIGNAVVENHTCVIVGDDNSQNCEVDILFVNKFSIRNDNIQNPTLPNLLET